MVSFKEKIGEEVEKQNQKKREIREVRGESLSIFIWIVMEIWVVKIKMAEKEF